MAILDWIGPILADLRLDFDLFGGSGAWILGVRGLDLGHLTYLEGAGPGFWPILTCLGGP